MVETEDEPIEVAPPVDAHFVANIANTVPFLLEKEFDILFFGHCQHLFSPTNFWLKSEGFILERDGNNLL